MESEQQGFLENKLVIRGFFLEILLLSIKTIKGMLAINNNPPMAVFICVKVVVGYCRFSENVLVFFNTM